MSQRKMRPQGSPDLREKHFYYKYGPDTFKFTVTRDWKNAIRVVINDTFQAIWIPRSCIDVINDEIVPKNIHWIFYQRQTMHKLKLVKQIEKEQAA